MGGKFCMGLHDSLVGVDLRQILEMDAICHDFVS